MTRKKLTLEEIERLNAASRQRSLELRKRDTLPRVVREADRGGHVYTIRIIEAPVHTASPEE